jgi:hypothetical protein
MRDGTADERGRSKVAGWHGAVGIRGGAIWRAEMKLPGKVHEAWMEAKRAAGVSSRKSETGEELMRPYDELSEAAKELDRASVRAVYAAIKAVDEAPPDDG